MQAFAAQYTGSPDPVHRTIAFQIFAYVPRLILDQPINAIIEVLERGLAAETIPIQLNALKASSAFLTATDKDGKGRGARLIAPMLNVGCNRLRVVRLLTRIETDAAPTSQGLAGSISPGTYTFSFHRPRALSTPSFLSRIFSTHSYHSYSTA